MTYKTPLMAALLCVCGSGAMADGDKPMAYAEFAAKVPHIPLATCPDIVQAVDATCHVAMIEGKLHVLAFSKRGNRPMLEVRSEAGGRGASDFRISQLD